MITRRIDHYGVVVKSIKTHVETYFSHLFSSEAVGPSIHDPLQNVNVCFITVPGGCIELVEPIDETSPVYEFVRKKPAGYHHICIEVEDMDAAIAECIKNKQIVVSQPKPAVAFQQRKIAFVMGRDRLLWELLETKPSP